MPAASTEVACIVVAAGSGTRLGAGEPKAFVDVAGRSMLSRAVEGVRAAGIERVVAVVPDGRLAEAAALGVEAVTGGATRQDSVAAGLALVADAAIVLVHDAARCLTPAASFSAVVEAVRAGADGAIPVLPVVDTVRAVDGDALGVVVDRDGLRAMQTPQGFSAAALRDAYAAASEARTDDAALVQERGGRVVWVRGSELAFKVTTPDDLSRARALAGDVERVGIGTDAHAFVDEPGLALAGLLWPDERRLHGHSDGDAALHAVVDAILSAAGLGDIGGMVGTDDPRLAGADSATFVAEAVARVHADGWRVGNVALQVVAERPRLGPRRAEAQARIAELVGAPVSVSGTTSDGLGAMGRGEGVWAIATARLVRR